MKQEHVFFQGGVDETAFNAVCRGLPNLIKYDFLDIVKTNVP